MKRLNWAYGNRLHHVHFAIERGPVHNSHVNFVLSLIMAHDLVTNQRLEPLICFLFFFLVTNKDYSSYVITPPHRNTNLDLIQNRLPLLSWWTVTVETFHLSWYLWFICLMDGVACMLGSTHGLWCQTPITKTKANQLKQYFLLNKWHVTIGSVM